MKRFLFICALLAVAIFLVVLLRSSNPHAPQFRPLQAPPLVTASHNISYDFLNPRPFEGGEMWIHPASSRTNLEIFLYDIDGSRVLGRLTNGFPVARIDRSKLLCAQPVSGDRSLKERFFELVRRISHGRIRLARPTSDYSKEPHSYWLLDLENSSAARMGELPERPPFTFQLSPDSRYGFTPSHGNGREPDVYCFDFRRRSIRKLEVQGWNAGWWDQTKILILATNNDFVLHDVTTQKTSILIDSRRIAAFLRNNKIEEDPTKTRAFFIWNGREYDVYLTDTHRKYLAEESFLIKVERPDGRLTLLARRFKFEWSDNFDPTGRYYLYSGRGSGSASDGVFIRNAQSGTNRTLVTPTRDPYFSSPRFFGDSVIYVRSNKLWRISLDGKKNVQLFPP